MKRKENKVQIMQGVETLERVEFMYLGEIVSANQGLEKEITKRIGV